MSVKLVLADGQFLQFGDGVKATLLDWFKNADAHGVISLHADNGSWHVQKRHIAYVQEIKA